MLSFYLFISILNIYFRVIIYRWTICLSYQRNCNESSCSFCYLDYSIQMSSKYEQFGLTVHAVLSFDGPGMTIL